MSSRASALRAPAARRSSPGLQVVRRGSRSLIDRAGGRRSAPFVVAVAIVSAAVVFGVLLEQVVLAQSAFKLADLRARLTQVEAAHEELLLEAAKLESPDRIERFARDNLGMVEPAEVQYVVARLGSTRRGVSVRGHLAREALAGSALVAAADAGQGP